MVVFAVIITAPIGDFLMRLSSSALLEKCVGSEQINQCAHISSDANICNMSRYGISSSRSSNVVTSKPCSDRSVAQPTAYGHGYEQYLNHRGVNIDDIHSDADETFL